MRTVQTKTGSRSYNVYIGAGFLTDIPKLVRETSAPGKVAILTNKYLQNMYASEILEAFLSAGMHAEMVVIPVGERYKNLTNMQRIYKSLAQIGLDRRCVLVAVGGGVVCDIGGFAAATYLRGIGLYQVPTTLLAQVDASVGGKNGVDLPQGKNMVGTFYQPNAVFADVATLKTLKARELRCGLAEIIKHGIIYDAEYLHSVCSLAGKLLSRDISALDDAVLRSVQIKSEVVQQDEFDRGIRGILNFGHTVGHALEVLTGFKTIQHGEGVSIGMVCETEIAQRMGCCPAGTREVVEAALTAVKLPVRIPDNIEPSAILDAMGYDKKTVSGKITMALPTAIGSAKMFDSIPTDIILASLSNLRA